MDAKARYVGMVVNVSSCATPGVLSSLSVIFHSLPWWLTFLTFDSIVRGNQQSADIYTEPYYKQLTYDGIKKSIGVCAEMLNFVH